MSLRRRKLPKFLPIISLIILLVFLPIIYSLLRSAKSVEAAWVDDNFSYRNSIAITSHTAAENNVYVSATIDTSASGQFQSDCGDIRFTTVKGDILPYYIVSGCVSASTVVHVFFKSMPAGAQTLYYYYGNPSAANGFVAADFATQASNYVVGTVGSQEKGGAPVAYFKFDEGFGTATKDSVSTASSAFSGSPTWQTEDLCISQKCLMYDTTGNDSSSFVVPSGSPLNVGTSDFTFSIWQNVFQPATLGTGIYGTYPHNTSYNGDLSTGISDDRTTYFLYERDMSGVIQSFSFNYTAYFGKWTHLVWVRNGSLMKLYINGSFIQNYTITNTPNINFTGDTFYFQNTGWRTASTMYLDEFKVFNYARTAAQVKADFKSRGQTKGTTASLGSNTKNSDALSNGLIGYWKTDEATWSGTASEVIDASGNGNHGTANGVTGGKAYTSGGKFGNAGFFDGIDDYVQSPLIPSVTITGTYTFSAWVKPNSSAGTQTIFQNSNSGSDRNGMDYNNNTVHFGYYDGSSWHGVQGQITANVWSHVVGTNNNRTLTLYINGTPYTTEAAGIPYVGAAGSYMITGATSTVGQYGVFKGLIDEVRIYNRTLSPKEVRDLYAFAPGPIGYWNLDEGQGNTVNDTSGNSYTGNWNGTIANQWTQGKYGKSGYFNASDDVTITSNQTLEATRGATFELWVNPADTGQFRNIAGKLSFLTPTGYSYGFRRPSNDVIFAEIYVNGNQYRISEPSALSINTWAHYALTYDGSIFKAYKNGVLISSTSVTGSIDASAGNTLGIGTSGGYSRFKGQLDDVKLYNYARTQKQIVEDMNAGHPAGGSPVGSQIAYYRFDEGQGSVANNSGSGSNINGTITNALWSNNGKFGKALSFDGDSDVVTTAADSSIDTSLAHTYTFWFNATTWQSNKAIVSDWTGNDLGTMIYIQTASTICAYINNTEKYCGTVPSAGVWHYGALVYDTNYISLYLDGKLQGSTAAGTADGGNFQIGEYNSGSTTSFTGLIDEVKIYNSALTSDEIALDYTRGSAMVLGTSSDTSSVTGGSIASSSAGAIYCVPGSTDTCSPPIGEWNFEEGSGNANDTSGRNFTGTLIGSPQRITGKTGKGINIDGSTQGIDIYSSGFANAFSGAEGTISLWAKVSSPSIWTDGATRRLFTIGADANNRVLIGRTAADNTLQFVYVANGTTQSINSTIGPSNNWFHITIAWSKSADYVKAYVNGVQSGTTQTGLQTFTGSLASTTTVIGAGSNTPTVSWSGGLDQVKIYNYARTQAQIASDYNQGKPVGHWRMDDCQGSVVKDSSGNGNDGNITIGASGTQTAVGTCTTSGTAWFGGVIGKFNSSLNFDGSDDYISVPDPASGVLDFGASQNFTITAWIKTNSNVAWDRLIGKTSTPRSETSWYSVAINSGKARLELATTYPTYYITADSVSSVNDNNWHHLVFSRDKTGSNNIKVYVDGKLETTSGADPTDSLSNSAPLNLMKDQDGVANRYLEGQIDDVRIYNYALTASQVKTLYGNGTINFGPSSGTP